MSPYLRREAVASARIEGTDATIVDLYDAEASDRPFGADVEEVANYITALETGLEQLRTLPVSTRLIREMHAVILAGVRGRERQPGELRRTQNWIGPPGATIETATFVPPPPDEVGRLMTDLEKFVHEETIHPFLDGNGRLGRSFAPNGSPICASPTGSESKRRPVAAQISSLISCSSSPCSPLDSSRRG